jgi:hypothetical protein
VVRRARGIGMMSGVRLEDDVLTVREAAGRIDTEEGET